MLAPLEDLHRTQRGVSAMVAMTHDVLDRSKACMAKGVVNQHSSGTCNTSDDKHKLTMSIILSIIHQCDYTVIHLVNVCAILDRRSPCPRWSSSFAAAGSTGGGVPRQQRRPRRQAGRHPAPQGKYHVSVMVMNPQGMQVTTCECRNGNESTVQVTTCECYHGTL